MTILLSELSDVTGSGVYEIEGRQIWISQKDFERIVAYRGLGRDAEFPLSHSYSASGEDPQVHHILWPQA